ncbi:MAG TPA: phospho-N-acetylmuramoyl-pentapeptide-transferase [Firmicutes bacterium]|nr:phospho-N-acetylmuramoyl-pentapeptide-transferase [Bacillota bacterium]
MSEQSIIILAGLLAFAISLLIGPAIIRFLYKVKFGQSIRAAGPASHQKKKGTPTMGGIIIILALAGASLFTMPLLPAAATKRLLPFALFVVLGYGFIGLIDDFLIVATKRTTGLLARYKLLGQAAVALVVALYALRDPRVGTALLLPFTGTFLPPLPDALFILVVLATLMGSANGVNFADGLDGLAAGATAVAAAVYAVVAYNLGAGDLALFAAATAGACLGFAWYNSHPAQVFMGDTGSLALGGALGALAVLTRTELLLLIIGGLFVIETLSVVLQVVYFRLTGGKRIFRMSPLHHHYELVGWAETKVVTRFWLIALLFGCLGLAAYK